MQVFENIEYDRTEFEKCLRGELYDTKFKGRDEAILKAHDLCWEFNNLRPSQVEEHAVIIDKLLLKHGVNTYVEPSIWVDFGFNMEVGDNFYANLGCMFQDAGKLTFGDNVFIGPNCSFYTACHPIDYRLRNKLLEYALPITVGDNVWFGGDVTVRPGVKIGNNVVIGAGSVVVHDIPDNSVAAGNPCRVIRPT